MIDRFNKAKANPENFEYYLPDYYDFARMGDMNDEYNDMSYPQFITWNMEKIAQLSDEDRAWLRGLCRRIHVDNIRQVDLDSCVEWDSCGFYYNPRGRLCIMHPR
jgi:hypothetical protein